MAWNENLRWKRWTLSTQLVHWATVGAGATLSFAVNDLLCIADSETDSSALSNIGKAYGSGKWYAELVRMTNVDDYTAFGIAPSDWNVETYPGSGAEDVGFYDGNTYTDGSNISGPHSDWVQYGVIGIAMDMINRKVWFSMDGTFLEGAGAGDPDPETETDPMWDYAGGWTNEKSYHIVGDPYAIGESILLLGSEEYFTYSIPSGYKAWNVAG